MKTLPSTTNSIQVKDTSKKLSLLREGLDDLISCARDLSHDDLEQAKEKLMVEIGDAISIQTQPLSIRKKIDAGIKLSTNYMLKNPTFIILAVAVIVVVKTHIQSYTICLPGKVLCNPGPDAGGRLWSTSHCDSTRNCGPNKWVGYPRVG